MKKVLLSDYFDIVSSKQDDKINFELSDKNNQKAIPFIGRSSGNNGVVDYVTPRHTKINDGKVLTIALDGSTGSTFYQHHDFASGQNIWLLIPKKEKISEFSPIISMFIVTTIKKAVQNYTYNLSLTKTRLIKVKILLPLLKNGNLDISEIKKIMNKIRNIESISNISDKRLFGLK